MANGRMPVGRLGSGAVAKQLARGFAKCRLGSRDPDKLARRERLAGEGAGIGAGIFAEPAAHGGLPCWPCSATRPGRDAKPF